VSTPRSGDQARGWYADPAGRFQYRFWDGTAWTGRVASQGVEHVDAPVSVNRPSRPAGPPSRRWPIVVALTVLVGALVATSLFVLGPKRRHSEQADRATTTTRPTTTTTAPAILAGAVFAPGSGAFTTDLGRGSFQVRELHLLAGQTAVIGWHVRTGAAEVRVGIASATVDQLSDRQYVGTAQRATAVQDAESLLVDLPSLTGSGSSLTVNSPTITIGTFVGVVLGPPDTLVAPVEGDYAVIVAGTLDKTAVDFSIAVRGEPSVTGNLRAADYNALIAGPFRDAVNRFVLAYCNANPMLDRGACDRFQTDTDGWAGTGAGPAPDQVDNGPNTSGSSGRSTTTQRRSSTSSTSTSTP